jgi:hypothetical protein
MLRTLGFLRGPLFDIYVDGVEVAVGCWHGGTLGPVRQLFALYGQRKIQFRGQSPCRRLQQLR